MERQKQTDRQQTVRQKKKIDNSEWFERTNRKNGRDNMKKKTSYRWLIWIIMAVVLIGVALMHILPPYIDRWKSARDYDKLAEEYVNDESEPDDKRFRC